MNSSHYDKKLVNQNIGQLSKHRFIGLKQTIDDKIKYINERKESIISKCESAGRLLESDNKPHNKSQEMLMDSIYKSDTRDTNTIDRFQ